MLLQSVTSALDLANGARLVITHLSKRKIKARILMGGHVGDIVCLPRINLDTNEDTKGIPFILRREQFPIRPVFSITSNKSKGQTLK
jgi:hypothetical protein